MLHHCGMDAGDRHQHNENGHHHSDAAVDVEKGHAKGAGEAEQSGQACCGLSFEELDHEDLGTRQELRSEDEQNKFVASMIRKGLYCDDWKLVITGALLHANGMSCLAAMRFNCLFCCLCCACLVFLLVLLPMLLLSGS